MHAQVAGNHTLFGIGVHSGGTAVMMPTFACILGCAMPSVDSAVIPELMRAPGASAVIW